MLSGEEMAARLATALQTPAKMQYQVLENEQGQLVFPAPPTPVLQVGNVDSAGRVRQGDGTGNMPVIEANSVTMVGHTAILRTYLAGLITSYKADGVAIAGTNPGPWNPVVPVQAIEAAGAVPNAEIAPLDATRRIDVILDMLVSSAAGGVCVVAMEQDHAGTPAACTPDWGAVTFTVGAGVTHFPGFVRCMTSAANVDIGLDGSASDLPANDDSFTFWGYYRYVA